MEKKAKLKTETLTLRLSQELSEDFFKMSEEMDIAASQLVRDLMKRQIDLYKENKKSKGKNNGR
jgi:antitoxin component of RelBE/YafQ-DinJ toxin-antitoxin module